MPHNSHSQLTSLDEKHFSCLTHPEFPFQRDLEQAMGLCSSMKELLFLSNQKGVDHVCVIQVLFFIFSLTNVMYTRELRFKYSKMII